jgi:hypothetical protein
VLFTSLAAFSTSEETVATSNVRSDASSLKEIWLLTPEVIAAKVGPSGTLRFTEPALALSIGCGDGSLNGAYLLGEIKDFCGVCIRRAVLALIGSGIFRPLLSFGPLLNYLSMIK